MIITVSFILAKDFWGECTVWLYGAFLRKEGKIQVLTGLAPSKQTELSFLRTPWLTKPTRKYYKWYINATQFGNFFTTKMMFNFTIWQLLPNSFNGNRTMAKKRCTTTIYFSNITT